MDPVGVQRQQDAEPRLTASMSRSCCAWRSWTATWRIPPCPSWSLEGDDPFIITNRSLIQRMERIGSILTGSRTDRPLGRSSQTWRSRQTTRRRSSTCANPSADLASYSPPRGRVPRAVGAPHAAGRHRRAQRPATFSGPPPRRSESRAEPRRRWRRARRLPRPRGVVPDRVVVVARPRVVEWKVELAALSPRSFGRVVTLRGATRRSSRCHGTAEQRALLEFVDDVLPSRPQTRSASRRHSSAPRSCRHRGVRQGVPRPGAPRRGGGRSGQATAEDLLGVALDADGEHVRNTDTVRRIVTALRRRASGGGAAGHSDKWALHRGVLIDAAEGDGDSEREAARRGAEHVQAAASRYARLGASKEG